MPSTVFVQVVGFRDVERHAINTVFRLSMQRQTAYSLWMPDSPQPAHLALIDVDSYEGGLAVASPAFNKNLKLIAVGERAPDFAWRVFERPLNWPAVVHAMDQLFATPVNHGGQTDADSTRPAALPPGIRASLLVDTDRDRRMYLRARLALAGLTEVDDASDAGQALVLARHKHYGVVIVNVDDPALDGWKLAQQLVGLEPAIGAVVVSSRQTSWALLQRVEQLGGRGLLEVPFDPLQIQQLLLKI
jgi:CheY-like chemotaxis protein